MGLSEISETASRAAEAAKRQILIAAVSGALCLTSFGFGIAAAFLALSAELGAVKACLVIAGASGMVALALGVNLRSAPAPSQQMPKAPPRQDAVQHLVSTFIAGVGAGRDFGNRQ